MNCRWRLRRLPMNRDRYMKKAMLYRALVLATSSIIAAGVVAAPVSSEDSPKRGAFKTRREAKIAANMQQVIFEIAGADNSQAAAIEKSLADNKLKARLHADKGEAKSKPMRLIADVERGADLSPWIKAVAAVSPRRAREPSPSLLLVVYAQINKESGTQALAHLDKLKGVDAKHSIADVRMGELRIRLTGNDPVTLSDISGVLQDAGPVGQFIKIGKPE
jgi:hypothetical protein